MNLARPAGGHSPLAFGASLGPVAAAAVPAVGAVSDLAAGQCQYEVTAIIEPPISCPFTAPPDPSLSDATS